jgi:hypothetical protein
VVLKFGEVLLRLALAHTDFSREPLHGWKAEAVLARKPQEAPIANFRTLVDGG